MSPPRYIYQRRGGPLLSWVNGPPKAVRAGETRALGSLGDDDVFDQPRVLPRPGAPEYLSLYAGPGGGPRHKAMGDCGCGGSCGGCGEPPSFIDGVFIGAGLVASIFLLFKRP